MTFFYDLNKRLADIQTKQQSAALTEGRAVEGSTGDYSAKKASAGKDIGKPGKQFAKIAKGAAERYGSKERGEKVAGAVLAKLRAKESIEPDMEEGNEFSGALARARASGAKEFEVDGKTYDVKEQSAWPGSKEYKRQHGTDLEAFRLRHAPSVMRDPDARQELAKMDADLERLKKMRRGELDPDELGDEPPAGEKRGRGRPKGSKRAIGAKGPTGRSKLLRMAEGDNDIRDDLAYEIEQILDGAIEGTDQTDHIIDELGDLYDRIESSGDKVALKAYSMMNGSIDQGTHAQVRAAQMALKRLKSDIKEDYDKDEYDEEGEMAMSQARVIADAAEELQSILDADENLPEWVQKKITLAKEYIDSARDYLKANRPEEQGMEESALQAYLGNKKYGKEGMAALQKAGRDGASKEKMARIRAQHDKLDEVDLEEKAVSRAQRAAAGIARAAQKGDIPKSELRGASKEMAKMPAGELRKFAKTKEKGLPAKVKEGGIDPNRHPQTKDYGRGDDLPFDADDDASDRDQFGNQIKNQARHLARKGMRQAMDTKAKDKNKDKDKDEEAKVDETTTAGSVATSAAEPAKKGKGGVQFGKGIYDSMNREIERLIAESMSVNMSDSTEGGRSLTVTATDGDAMKLAAMLKMAGLDAAGDQEQSSVCDAVEEAYGDVEPTENQPDYPTDTEQSDDALQYAGGLNRPKTTGQTTVPVIASQLARQVSEENSELARMREMAGIREAARPDFPDIDDDGDRKEPIAKAAQDAEEEKVAEAVEGSLWALYKRIA